MYVIYVYCIKVFFIKVPYFTVFTVSTIFTFFILVFFQCLHENSFKVSRTNSDLEEQVGLDQITCSVVYATPVAGWLVAQDSRTIIESCSGFQDVTTLEELVKVCRN